MARQDTLGDGLREQLFAIREQVFFHLYFPFTSNVFICFAPSNFPLLFWSALLSFLQRKKGCKLAFQNK